MSRSWYVRSKYSRVLCERFSVDVPCASGARVILSSSCTTEYTADCPSDSPRTIQTSIRSRRREGTNMFLSCLQLLVLSCLASGHCITSGTCLLRRRPLCWGSMSAPGKIIMIRHGQSAANADTSIYNRVPDYRIPLTPLGLEQAKAAGERIRRELDGQEVSVYVSPYLRAYQTLEALNLGSLTERVVEEPRLREQDWANFQIAGEIEDQKELRNAYGHFFYRFREGESGSDVYDRISSFMETLYRHWAKPDYSRQYPPCHARPHHAPVLHALVPLVRGILRVAEQPRQR